MPPLAQAIDKFHCAASRLAEDTGSEENNKGRELTLDSLKTGWPSVHDTTVMVSGWQLLIQMRTGQSKLNSAAVSVGFLTQRRQRKVLNSGGDAIEDVIEKTESKAAGGGAAV
ncbi:MAG: hypothetical protein M1821_002933 [Bathelium mastoideum]|nr:MAG: hypothetical protein M1821_002933 [Bathelium mastoideum]